MNIYNIYLTNELIGSVSGSSANCNELYMNKAFVENTRRLYDSAVYACAEVMKKSRNSNCACLLGNRSCDGIT